MANIPPKIVKKEEQAIVIESPKVLPYAEMPKEETETTKIEAILQDAPVLPWKIDLTYIDKDFRKAYVALLKKLVELNGLSYNVDQTGTLTPK